MSRQDAGSDARRAPEGRGPRMGPRQWEAGAEPTPAGRPKGAGPGWAHVNGRQDAGPTDNNGTVPLRFINGGRMVLLAKAF
jgi:hypothetical protein